jgi:hypothetical protein
VKNLKTFLLLLLLPAFALAQQSIVFNNPSYTSSGGISKSNISLGCTSSASAILNI